jgi:hypothetical protein
VPKRKSDYVIFNVSTKRLRTVNNELISPLRNGTVSNAQKAKLRELVTRPKGALDIELAKVLGWKSLSNALAFAREASSGHLIFQVKDKSGMRCYATK